jgi:hypothetical protein
VNVERLQFLVSFIMVSFQENWYVMYVMSLEVIYKRDCYSLRVSGVGTTSS